MVKREACKDCGEVGSRSSSTSVGQTATLAASTTSHPHPPSPLASKSQLQPAVRDWKVLRQQMKGWHNWRGRSKSAGSALDGPPKIAASHSIPKGCCRLSPMAKPTPEYSGFTAARTRVVCVREPVKRASVASSVRLVVKQRLLHHVYSGRPSDL